MVGKGGADSPDSLGNVALPEGVSRREAVLILMALRRVKKGRFGRVVVTVSDGRVVDAMIAGRSPEPFAYRPLGVLAGLGRQCAVAEILGFRFSGWFAWWLWRTVYLLKLPGLERKVRVALDWTLDLFFARDIVYLRPLHGERGEDRIALTGQDASTRTVPP